MLLIGPDSQNRLPGDVQCIATIDFVVVPGYASSEFTLAFVGSECGCSSNCSLPRLTRSSTRMKGPDYCNRSTSGASDSKQMTLSKLTHNAELMYSMSILYGREWEIEDQNALSAYTAKPA